MDTITKICELRGIIDAVLRPLIGRDYRLLEVPDYANPGDMLIFQGEMEFLKTLKVRCLEMSTMSSFASRSPTIMSDELLIFSGGGYFGDLYPRGPQFQRTVLQRYPDNPALILPQSTWFTDEHKLADAVRFYGARTNLSICLRDRQSYDFVRKHFPNPTFLVPDMAFFADLSEFREAQVESCTERTLLLARRDGELRESPTLTRFREDPRVDVFDWPSLVTPSSAQMFMQLLRRHPGRFGKLIDWYARHGFRKSLLRRALGLLAPYETVASTRLHGAILSLLLGKKVIMLDNSYGKNRSLYETWLWDCDTIRME
ncbi:MAG: polysaccharide pyruvyl transferase family protein [Victivallales bacterium]|nr:polysaccharide pyruvyl transferase family protein [Victivallales bacterium]